jgi:hypothetical protein
VQFLDGCSLSKHGMVKSFVHPLYGLQHKSTIDVKWSTITAHQFNNQSDCRSITKWTNVRAQIWTAVLHDWERACYQLSYQPLTFPMFTNGHEYMLGDVVHWWHQGPWFPTRQKLIIWNFVVNYKYLLTFVFQFKDINNRSKWHKWCLQLFFR